MPGPGRPRKNPLPSAHPSKQTHVDIAAELAEAEAEESESQGEESD